MYGSLIVFSAPLGSTHTLQISPWFKPESSLSSVLSNGNRYPADDPRLLKKISSTVFYKGYCRLCVHVIM